MISISNFIKILKNLIFYDFHYFFIEYWSIFHQKPIQTGPKTVQNDPKRSKMIKLCDNVMKKIYYWSQISLKSWKFSFTMIFIDFCITMLKIPSKIDSKWFKLIKNDPKLYNYVISNWVQNLNFWHQNSLKLWKN